MQEPSVSSHGIGEVFARRADMVYRIAFAYVKNAADAEDITQTAFLQLIRKAPRFENEEHEKAWLIRTTINLSKNLLKHWWRKREDVDENTVPCADETGRDEVLEAVLALPEKYRTVICLRYFEGYSGEEIAALVKRPSSTVRNRLRKARALLKEKLGGDPDDR